MQFNNGGIMDLKVRMAEAIVNDFIFDDGHVAECLACNSFGDFPGNINHTSSCIVLEAKSFLKELENEGGD